MKLDTIEGILEEVKEISEFEGPWPGERTVAILPSGPWTTW